MLIAAFIFVISLATMVQFAVSSWRAGLFRVASQPVATEGELAAELSRKLLNIRNFHDAALYQDVCPALEADSGPSLRLVRVYYGFLQLLNALGEAVLPSAASAASSSWTDREMALCTRYATVVLSQRLQRNQALSAEVRSY